MAAAISIPLLHIADATAEALARDMEHDFYKGRLVNRHGLEVIVPEAADRRIVHDVIFQELCLGTVKSSSKDAFLHIVDSLAAIGAEAVILGCTEIGMLLTQRDTAVPLYDTTKLHAAKAVAWATQT